MATEPRLSIMDLATRRPVALLALLPKPLVLFSAGALSGAIAKTITAPLDRVKILLQVKGGLQSGAIAQAAAKGNLLQSLIAVGQQEGIMGYWKGNLPQVLRVVPYSAAQLYSYEVFKQWLSDDQGHLSIHRRFAAGAAAGMTATIVSARYQQKDVLHCPQNATAPLSLIPGLVSSYSIPPFLQLTHPLDTLRLRMAVDPQCTNLLTTIRILAKQGGLPAFYRGLGASMLGIAPYMALELACYDLLPQEMPSFARGFTSAFIATVSCYPLDTIRRRIQLEAAKAVPWQTAVGAILAQDGLGGMYRGFIPNAVKNLPNKGVKLTVFDKAKKALILGQTAYEEECAAAGIKGEALLKM